MLDLVIPGGEFYNAQTNRFTEVESKAISLEHSLVSLSKWESIHKKPFFGDDEKTSSETLSYIQCMSLNPEISPEEILRLTPDQISRINDYIGESQTATTIRRAPGRSSREIITSEIIYYWMVAQNIPFETQYWPLSRLLTLVEVCAIKNQPKKKMDRSSALSQQRAINAQRRASLNTQG